MNGVHALYKNLGETPLECVERFRKEYSEFAGVRMTYAGRLDPVAEGLLLVLLGDAVHEKDKYLGLPKTYVCEVLWGMETDSLDILGLVASENFSLKFPSGDAIQNILKDLKGKIQQRYPVFSSKPVNGKPLFQWAREGRLGEIEIPSHEVEVFNAEFVSRRTVSGAELLKSIREKILLVRGDFRQEEILEKWGDVLAKLDQAEFTIDTLRLTVSSGFYVRQFVSDLAKQFDVLATTFHIKRTRIGDFHSDL